MFERFLSPQRSEMPDIDMELVFTDIFAAYFLMPSGRAGEYSTVRLGSGDGPMFSSVWRKRKSVFVTIDRPSIPKPATSSVAQTGSPENNWLYDGMRANLTIRNFITIWSINSCASSSVNVPSCKSRLMYGKFHRSGMENSVDVGRLHS